MNSESEHGMTKEEHHLACEIGLIMRRLRRAHGLTQKGLAQRVADGMEATYVGKIERGEQLPSLKVLLRLSTALEVTISTFFYPPESSMADRASPPLHLEPLLQALHNRGIDGTALVRALLEALGQHVLVVPPRRQDVVDTERGPRAERRSVIPLPMPQSSRE
jgi:transcriptional regulator with XRE-family HTH domain